MNKQETLVYLGMREGNEILKRKKPNIQIVADMCAPAVYDNSKNGGTATALGKNVDELVTEWTPVGEKRELI